MEDVSVINITLANNILENSVKHLSTKEVKVQWPTVDLCQILDWMGHNDDKSLNIEADIVYVKNNLTVTGLKKLKVTAFQLIFFKNNDMF